MVKAEKKSKTPKLVKQHEEEEEEVNGNVKEGYNLLGSPTFEKLENGRFKCLETGHEMLPKDKELYSNSKRCRLGLIDAALLNKKPPLNMFKQDPHCKLKLVCKLTGDIVNKTEEHIWKHVNGKRFLNKLEQKEAENLTSKEIAVEKVEDKLLKKSKLNANGEKKDRKKKDKIKKDKSNEVDKDAMRDPQTSDSEEPEFWSPPVGDRWDFDNGKDRWGSDSESGPESDNENMKEGADTENDVESGELTTRTKRMSIEVGPSSFASRKKKRKTKSAADGSIA
ncbi:Surfeit locus protein 2 (SURF2) [Thalictrum thalictroides]|uniref:Surfeit locus protein 2 (SURF2) n=1 Tax=Thalictrum thalictroides TaxID=46969 RepID=A0A7J6WHW1_THATH|nr:Surfeit locus protein 2 (SURF2) [Thalictrum thalictroides]